MGDVYSRIERAASWLENLVRNVLIYLAPQFLSVLFAVVITFLIQPMLAAVLVAGVLAYVLILMAIVPQAAEISRTVHRSFSRAYGDAYDTLMNVASVKQATAESFEKRKLSRNFFARAFRFWIDGRKLWGLLNIWQRILIASVQLIIFVVGVFLIRKGALTIGQLVMFNGYAAMFFGPFVVLGRNWETIQNGIVAIERAEKILALPKEDYVPKDAVILEDFTGDVVFEKVSFGYDKRRKNTLSDISFHARPGERVALVGESGVGKTTLLDLVSYYYQPSSGSILIDGHRIEKFDLKFLRSQVAIVPQEILLFNDTVKNNIRYGSFNKNDAEVEDAARKAHADEFIRSFPNQYGQIVGERGIKLSMGQKQRIAIARAILRDPKILILDEPTSALDAKSEKFIQESLRELMSGRTTFIIAHRLSTVREAVRILVLEKGTIVESGTHDDLVKKDNGVYRKLYELQIDFS